MSYSFEGFRGSTQAIYFGVAVKYHIIGRYGGHIWQTLGFWELNARVELILSTGEG